MSYNYFYLTFNTDLIFLHVSVSLVESSRVEAAVKTADITNSVSACDVIRQTCNYTDTVFSKSVALPQTMVDYTV